MFTRLIAILVVLQPAQAVAPTISCCPRTPQQHWDRLHEKPSIVSCIIVESIQHTGCAPNSQGSKSQPHTLRTNHGLHMLYKCIVSLTHQRRRRAVLGDKVQMNLVFDRCALSPRGVCKQVSCREPHVGLIPAA